MTSGLPTLQLRIIGGMRGRGKETQEKGKRKKKRKGGRKERKREKEKKGGKREMKKEEMAEKIRIETICPHKSREQCFIVKSLDDATDKD